MPDIRWVFGFEVRPSSNRTTATRHRGRQTSRTREISSPDPHAHRGRRRRPSRAHRSSSFDTDTETDFVRKKQSREADRIARSLLFAGLGLDPLSDIHSRTNTLARESRRSKTYEHTWKKEWEGRKGSVVQRELRATLDLETKAFGIGVSIEQKGAGGGSRQRSMRTRNDETERSFSEEADEDNATDRWGDRRWSSIRHGKRSGDDTSKGYSSKRSKKIGSFWSNLFKKRTEKNAPSSAKRTFGRFKTDSKHDHVHRRRYHRDRSPDRNASRTSVDEWLRTSNHPHQTTRANSAERTTEGRPDGRRTDTNHVAAPTSESSANPRRSSNRSAKSGTREIDLSLSRKRMCEIFGQSRPFGEEREPWSTIIKVSKQYDDESSERWLRRCGFTWDGETERESAGNRDRSGHGRSRRRARLFAPPGKISFAPIDEDRTLSRLEEQQKQLLKEKACERMWRYHDRKMGRRQRSGDE
ncbi:hypothetical protein IAR55_004638 [Kwoniella newhampshirensis]|uniref:Uncharacterized protein n=1 Tax=Kwoniella newhampshirensis TaxID=1651941 RepID=A0AAW0YLC4_9TREE